MPDAYTRISKPTDTTYVYVNTQGKEQYNQSNLIYDDASTFYNGVNQNAYTNVAKPALASTSVGIASGLIMPLTFRSTAYSDQYTKIPKPIT